MSKATRDGKYLSSYTSIKIETIARKMIEKSGVLESLTFYSCSGRSSKLLHSKCSRWVGETYSRPGETASLARKEGAALPKRRASNDPPVKTGNGENIVI
tara:strand:- start:101 stop:400 length:300 start_codon:yes stop_codon:yes gene_type:complete